LVQVPRIPDKFNDKKEYTSSFRRPFLVEVWHNIYLGMSSMSKHLTVEQVHFSDPPTLAVEQVHCSNPCFKKKKKDCSEEVEVYHDILLIVPKTGNPPKRHDLFLMSERKVNCREEILNESVSCTILWVDAVSHVPVDEQVHQGTLIKMKARLACKPFHLTDLTKMSYAVHLTNMTTFDRVWEVNRKAAFSEMSIINEDHVSVSSSIFPSTNSLHCTRGQTILHGKVLLIDNMPFSY
jgi:hypothetical protein